MQPCDVPRFRLSEITVRAVGKKLFNLSDIRGFFVRVRMGHALLQAVAQCPCKISTHERKTLSRLLLNDWQTHRNRFIPS
jgi:hypothetical protein